VEHRLDGERGDVGGADDVADGEGGTQLGPAFLESISEWRADNRWWTKLANEVGTARVEVARCSLERDVGADSQRRLLHPLTELEEDGLDARDPARVLAPGIPRASSRPPWVVSGRA
jgi:hypothetical protein